MKTERTVQYLMKLELLAWLKLLDIQVVVFCRQMHHFLNFWGEFKRKLNWTYWTSKSWSCLVRHCSWLARHSSLTLKNEILTFFILRIWIYLFHWKLCFCRSAFSWILIFLKRYQRLPTPKGQAPLNPTLPLSAAGVRNT